jgi:hypothetical protein
VPEPAAPFARENPDKGEDRQPAASDELNRSTFGRAGRRLRLAPVERLVRVFRFQHLIASGGG